MEMINVDFGDGRIEKFKKGGKRRVSFGDGAVCVQGEIKAKDGTIFEALLDIDELSSGEHGGTMIWTEKGLADQADKDFLEQINKTADDFFPYAYKYREALHCEDIHSAAGVWSVDFVPDF